MINLLLCTFCISFCVRIDSSNAYKYLTPCPDVQETDSRTRVKNANFPRSGRSEACDALTEKAKQVHKNAPKKHSHTGEKYSSYDLDGFLEKLEDIEFNEGYNSIENVDESRTQEISSENDKNLLLFFYNKDNKCPDCRDALEKLEEIKEEVESSGYIEVVKSRDKLFAAKLGVYKMPAIVYFRRSNPILYTGNFHDSQEIYRWVRAHDQIITIDLEDKNFELYTDSYSPSAGSLDWFILFYASKNVECNSYIALWENVAHQLRGYVNVAKVDIHKSDDVASRFNIDEDEDCPSFILMRGGKMYKFNEMSRHPDSYATFALRGYREQRGKRVPEPPTLMRTMFEEIKEFLAQQMVGNMSKILVAIGCAVVFLAAGLFLCSMKRKEKRRGTDNKKNT